MRVVQVYEKRASERASEPAAAATNEKEIKIIRRALAHLR